MDDESAAMTLQTDAYDDEGRGDELNRELQSLEGPAINHIQQLPNNGYCKMSKPLNQKLRPVR